MIAVTDRFLDTLRGQHTLSVAAYVYRPSAPLVAIQVPVIDGTVTMDADARSRRQGTLEAAFSLTDPFTPDVISEIAYGGYCVLERGVMYADGEIERVQLGRFRVDSVVWSSAESRASLTLSDRMAQVAEEPFLAPWAPTGKPSDACKTAVYDVFGDSITYSILTTPATESALSGMTIYDQDRVQALNDLASTVGAEAYFDHYGNFVLKPRAVPSVPSWVLDAGENGSLVAASESLDRSSVRNGVAVRGQGDPSTPAIFALATHNDPTSPVRWGGPFGKVAMIVTLTGIATQAQADATAASLLNLRLRLARTVTLRGIPNPALEPGDLIEIRYPDRRTEQQVVNAVSIGLGVTGALDLTCKSIAPDATAVEPSPASVMLYQGDTAWRELEEAVIA